MDWLARYRPENRIDLPYGYCIIDVLLCMILIDCADLLIETKHGHVEMKFSGIYHVMREDRLGLRFPKQV